MNEMSVGIETCSIGVCSDFYEGLMKIYKECKRERQKKKIIQLAEP